MNLCRHCGVPITHDWANDVTILRGNKAETTEAWVANQGGSLWCWNTQRHQPLSVTLDDMIAGLKAMRADLR